MQRNRKSTVENVTSVEPAESVEPGTPVKQVTVHRTERFTEPIQDDSAITFDETIRTDDERGDEPELPTGVELENEADRDLREFLENLKSDTRAWKIRVDRLPEYRDTGQWGRHAPREFCGDIDFDPANYEAQVQQAFGPGDYLITLHEANQFRFRHKWKIHIAEPLRATNDTPQPVNPFPVQPRARNVDPVDEILAVAEKYNRLRDAFAPKTQPEPVEPEVRTVEVETIRKLPLEEKLIERAFDYVIQKGDDNSIGAFVQNYFRRDEPRDSSPSLGGLLADIIGELKPVLTPLIANAVRQYTGAPAGAPALVEANPMIAMSGAPEASQQQNPGDIAWRRVVRRLIEDCAVNAPGEAGGYSALDLCEQFPEYEPIVMQLTTMGARSVLDMLIAVEPRANFLLTLAHSEAYVLRLQQCILDEMQEPNEPQQTTEPAASSATTPAER
jgi:hypothetical protein